MARYRVHGAGRIPKRENSFLTHAPGGAFCYGSYPHGARGVGSGTRYRATVIGPGVTPEVMWQGPAPGAYDAAGDAEANAAQRECSRATATASSTRAPDACSRYSQGRGRLLAQ